MVNKQLGFLIILLILFSVSPCRAQEYSLSTDRPDQGDGVQIVPKYKFQIENGILFSEETVYNNFMLRYGLTKSTELRLQFDFGKEFENYGLQPVTFSLKQRIIVQNGLVPAITFVGYVSAPKWASPDFKKKDYDYELKFAFENELNNRFSLGYNIGTSENFKNLKLTMGLDYSATENLSTYIEYYSTLNKIKNIHNLDVGLLYLFTPWFQVDIACGSPVIGDKFNFYTTFGISYLFK